MERRDGFVYINGFFLSSRCADRNYIIAHNGNATLIRIFTSKLRPVPRNVTYLDYEAQPEL